MSSRMRIDTKLKVRPVTRLELRAQSAAEWVVNLGGSESDGDIASRGVMRQAWKEIQVNGVNSKGQVRDRAIYRLTSTGDHLTQVLIDDDQGKSMLERVDAGIVEIVRRQAERFKRKGLRIEVHFIWADGIDEARKTLLRQELGTNAVQELEWDGEPVSVARLRPGKDPGSEFELVWGRKRR